MPRMRRVLISSPANVFELLMLQVRGIFKQSPETNFLYYFEPKRYSSCATNLFSECEMISLFHFVPLTLLNEERCLKIPHRATVVAVA